MEMTCVLLTLLLVVVSPSEQVEQNDALFIPTVNCLDEYHFCFGAKGNETSISKTRGCLSDMSCDVMLVADASDIKRIKWNLQMRKPTKFMEKTEKLVAFFYLAKEDVCQSCDYESVVTDFSKLPPDVLVVEYQLLDKNKAPKSRQFMIRTNKSTTSPQVGGPRQLFEYRAGDKTFDLKDDLVASDNYWGIMFTSSRKLIHGDEEVDVVRDPLRPHLFLSRMWYDSVNTKDHQTMNLITNVGLKKLLIFSDKEDDSEYHAQVRAWVIRIILMLTLLLLIAIGCVCYYRSQMGSSRHISPDNINDVFDQ